MDAIKLLPPMERPREKLQFQGVQTLTDAELLAILLGSGTPQVPLHMICERLLGEQGLSVIAKMNMTELCKIKGIGPAKATILLAAAEYCRRIKTMRLIDEQGAYHYLKSLLEPATQLQYILLLMSNGKELLAFAEAGSALPDISWITELAVKTGAGRILLGRNGWSAFSNLEARFKDELCAACGALGIICDGLMAVGPEHYKMI